MIRLLREGEVPAVLAADGGWPLFRLQTLLAAYGTGYDFCRFYLQEESGSLLACLDDSALLWTTEKADVGELASCLKMTEAGTLLTGEAAGRALVPLLPGAESRAGTILEKWASGGEGQNLREAADMPALREAYRLIAEGFGPIGDFTAWYCDLSHRLRHGVCRVFLQEGKACAVAAQRGDRILLSQVAVSPACRRTGVGTALIRAVEARYPGCLLAVYSRDGGTDLFYQKLGFRPAGRWLELRL